MAEDSRAEQMREISKLPRKPRRMIRQVCDVCGVRFESPRVTRRYCSNTCAQRAVRARKKNDQQEPQTAREAAPRQLKGHPG
jgi:hypothetical protein